MIGGTRKTATRTGTTAATAVTATAALAERKADEPRCEAVGEERCGRGEEGRRRMTMLGRRGGKGRRKSRGSDGLANSKGFESRESEKFQRVV